jgi:hypothetical protein
MSNLHEWFCQASTSFALTRLPLLKEIKQQTEPTAYHLAPKQKVIEALKPEWMIQEP